MIGAVALPERVTPEEAALVFRREARRNQHTNHIPEDQVPLR
jgi:hypothetical protein